MLGLPRLPVPVAYPGDPASEETNSLQTPGRRWRQVPEIGSEQRAVNARRRPWSSGRSSPLGQQERANLGFEQRGSLQVALVAQPREDPQCRPGDRVVKGLGDAQR